jgi:shikimate kinase
LETGALGVSPAGAVDDETGSLLHAHSITSTLSHEL